MVIGAYQEDSNATGVNGNQSGNSFNSLARRMFSSAADELTQQAYLKASNTGAIDHFGYSVAMSGDTVVIGAMKRTERHRG